MAERRDVGTITIQLPIDAVLAVRSSAEMSRAGISDDYEGYRHKGRDYEDMARRRAAEIVELDDILRQLGDDDDQARKVTADYDQLHGLVGDVLMGAIQDLRFAAGAYWRHEESIGEIDRHITTVNNHIALLREVEAAADERRASDPPPP